MLKTKESCKFLNVNAMNYEESCEMKKNTLRSGLSLEVIRLEVDWLVELDEEADWLSRVGLGSNGYNWAEASVGSKEMGGPCEVILRWFGLSHGLVLWYVNIVSKKITSLEVKNSIEDGS